MILRKFKEKRRLRVPVGTPDCACLNVRASGPRQNLDYRSFFIFGRYVWVYPNYLVQFSKETHLNSGVKLFSVIVVKHVALFTICAKLTMAFTFTSLNFQRAGLVNPCVGNTGYLAVKTPSIILKRYLVLEFSIFCPCIMTTLGWFKQFIINSRQLLKKLLVDLKSWFPKFVRAYSLFLAFLCFFSALLASLCFLVLRTDFLKYKWQRQTRNKHRWRTLGLFCLMAI